MEPVEPPVVELGPVDKTFRPFQPDQILLVPPSLDEWLPQDHLARFIADLVDEHLDLSAFYADYKQGRGAPPFDPRLMVRVLLLGYTMGVRSSRKLEEACWDKVAFRWLAGGQAPAYRAIAKFGKRHLSALGHLFVQALELCQAAGMVSLGQVALDGTKVRANASRRKAMSYTRMSEKHKILAAEVSDLLAEAERIDKDEDATFGGDNSGYGLPKELARREGRLAKITQAKAALPVGLHVVADAATDLEVLDLVGLDGSEVPESLDRRLEHVALERRRLVDQRRPGVAEPLPQVHRHEAALDPANVRHRRQVGGRHQPTVQAVGPGVVGALQVALDLAGRLGAEHRPTVAADVQERPELAVPPADDQDALPADLHGPERPGGREVARSLERTAQNHIDSKMAACSRAKISGSV